MCPVRLGTLKGSRTFNYTPPFPQNARNTLVGGVWGGGFATVKWMEMSIRNATALQWETGHSIDGPIMSLRLLWQESGS